MMMNKKFDGATLYEIDFTPKGTKEMTQVYVCATNTLNASQFLILNHIWGKQSAIRVHSSNFMK